MWPGSVSHTPRNIGCQHSVLLTTSTFGLRRRGVLHERIVENVAQQPPGAVSAADRAPKREVGGDKHERCRVGGAREPRVAQQASLEM